MAIINSYIAENAHIHAGVFYIFPCAVRQMIRAVRSWKCIKDATFGGCTNLVGDSVERFCFEGMVINPFQLCTLLYHEA